MAGWGAGKARPDGKIRDIVDNMFHTRFWDHGICAQCNAKATGIFGPEEQCDVFYCKTCWLTYLKGTNDDEWKQWTEWQPAARACVSESRQAHEIKCALLALAKAGGSMSFPCSAWARYTVHKFCEEEPELSCLTHKSYGEAAERFVMVATKNSRSACEEARAILATDLGAMDLDQLRAVEQEFAVGLARVQQEIAKKAGNADSIAQESVSNGNCENLQEEFANLTIVENVKSNADAISPPKAKGQPMPPPKAKAVPTPPPKAKAEPTAPPPKARAEPTPPPKAKLELSPSTKHEPIVTDEELCHQLQMADGLTNDYPALSNDFPSLASAGKKGGKKKK